MDFKEDKPIYLQIADRIMDEIIRSVYPEEKRIPSVREYASVMEVNANTVARSFDYLQQIAVIYTKRGLGYFVCANATERIMALRRKAFVEGDLPDMFRTIRLLQIPIEEIADRYRDYCRNLSI